MKPCSPTCPAITGKPEPGHPYCPAQHPERHRATPWEHSGRDIVRRGSERVVLDWRDGTWHPVTVVPVPPNAVRYEHDVPPNPEYTDCCADFRCCAKQIEDAGMTHLFAALAGAAQAGGGAIPVLVTPDGAVPLVTVPPKEEQ